MEDPSSAFYTDCSICDWDRFAAEEWQGKLLAVLHVLRSHPDEYYRTTGRHPEDAMKFYSDYLRQFKDLI